MKSKYVGQKVKARKPSRIRGVVVGEKLCHLEGCSGRRLAVRWDTGDLTWPCTKGMKIERGVWRIL